MTRIMRTMGGSQNLEGVRIRRQSKSVGSAIPGQKRPLRVPVWGWLLEGEFCNLRKEVVRYAESQICSWGSRQRRGGEKGGMSISDTDRQPFIFALQIECAKSVLGKFGV